MRKFSLCGGEQVTPVGVCRSAPARFVDGLGGFLGKCNKMCNVIKGKCYYEEEWDLAFEVGGVIIRVGQY